MLVILGIGFGLAFGLLSKKLVPSVTFFTLAACFVSVIAK